MTTLTGTQPTLAAMLWPATGSRPLRLALLAVIGSALIALSAQIAVPLWPVPITMQTFAVLVIGMAYGARLGAATVVLYLAEGALGLPVFSKFGAGVGHLAGPTGGYLIGFAVAAGLTGWLAERGWDRRPLTTGIAMLAGNGVIYALGLAWLAGLIGVEKAIAGGLVPFLVGDALKIALAVAVLPLAWKAVGRKGA